MAGSKTKIEFELIYDALNDKGYWVLRSDAVKLESVQPHRWEVIEEHMDNFEAVSKLAGPKPDVLVEEVVLTRKDNEEATDNSNTITENSTAEGK